jgi:dolichol-phosphate mannosyltransferase
MTITFVIPTLNEVENVDAIIDLVLPLMARLCVSCEILFVDDQSTDGTVESIQKRAETDSRIRLLSLPERKGLGFALWQGMLQVNTPFVLFLDCDMSVNESDLESLIHSRDKGKMVIGSRYLPASRIVNAPIVKVFLSRLLNRLVGLISGMETKDISHSLRIFEPDTSFVPDAYSHPAFFWNLSIYAHLSGVKIEEIPVTFVERRLGMTKNRLIGMMRSVRMGMFIVLKSRFSRASK